ncbi:MAG: thioesterase, partial [Nitrospinae bacterium]|nr:thioesterase [Nitrospinota bacterium]
PVPLPLRGTNAEVVATPEQVRVMENAAMDALEKHLAPDQTSVGTKVALTHMAGTPKGMRVEARARLIERDRRRCVFEVEIHDEVELVARGTNERFIVPRERKNEKLIRKIDKVNNQI